MTEPQGNQKKFHVSIGSVFAGLLFFGGLESLIRLSRDPAARGIVGLLHRFIKSNALMMRETHTDWVLISASFAVALIFLIAGVIVGASVLKRKQAALS